MGKVSVRVQSIPIQLLRGGLQLAKMYDMHDILSSLMPTVQQYLTCATFNFLAQSAIQSDIQLLRIRCLKFAEDESNKVKELYDSGQLAPEVMSELAGMWATPRAAEKRRRLM